MTNEELEKLDFQVATMRMLESNTAMLRTVLQNQIEIMKVLKMGNHEIIPALVNRLVHENLALVSNDLKSQVPEGQHLKFLKFPKN